MDFSVLKNIFTPKEFANLSYTANKKCYYVISLVLMFTEDDGSTTEIDLKDSMSDLICYRIFNEFVFPVITVKLTLDLETHIKICKNLDDVKFKLNVSKIESVEITDQESVPSDMAKTVFKDLILKPNDYDKQRFRDECENAIAFLHSQKVNVDVDLFLEDHLNLNKKIITGVYNNATVSSILASLLTKNTPNGNKVLLHKPLNETKYKQIILPSKNLSNTIYYLQMVYGLYPSGVRLFFDYDRTYCLCNDLKDRDPITEGKPNEYPNVVCYVGKEMSDTSAYYLDEKNNTYYLSMLNTDQFIFNDRSVKNILGKNITIKSSSQKNKTMSKQELDNNSKLENDDDETKQTKEVTTTETTTTTYVVQKNDNLTKIANKYNTTYQEIAAMNKISNVNLIYPGQVLVIPQQKTTTKKVTETTVNKSLKDDKEKKEEEKEKFYFSNYDNPYIRSEIETRLNLNMLTYTGVIRDVDLYYLTMNKALYLKFTDDNYSDYCGMYQIRGMITRFERVAPNVYSGISIMDMARLVKDHLSYS